jgi:NAD(P)-dependent dehydrogenase (short-subunit alcohol dehydrogenase family)
MGRLSGKSVIITGAGSGIGRAASLLFAAEGAKLVIADKFDTAEETARQVREAGGTVVALVGDAGEEAFVAGLVDRAVAEYGVLDAIWANAGISGGAVPREDQDADHWAEVLRVNLIGPFLAVKHASRVMVPRGRGSIVMTASVAGIRSGAGGMPYSASKAGVINLAQTAANDLYGTGVRVNAICPGYVNTPLVESQITDQAKARGISEEAVMRDVILAAQPTKQFVTVEQLGGLLLYLVSDAGASVNGAALTVDGGWTAA